MNINIPKKIKVGFQSRKSSLDGNLSFVTYINDKDQIAQEKSWNSWRDENVSPLDFNNIPLKGYFFDKSIKRTGGFSNSNSYMRVYDPRGFEFEIKIENVSLIIQNCTLDRGEIKEKCILGWEGRTIYLIPETSNLYKVSIQENLDENRIVTEDNLIIGNIYKSSKGSFVYIGKKYLLKDKNELKTKLVHVFYQEDNNYGKKDEINSYNFCTPSLSSLKNTQKQCENYDEMVKESEKKNIKRDGIKWLPFEEKSINNSKGYIKIKDSNNKNVFCNITRTYHLYLDYKNGKREDPITEYDFDIIKLIGTRLEKLGFSEERYVSRINLTILINILNKIKDEEKKDESERDFSFLLKGMIKEEDKLIEL